MRWQRTATRLSRAQLSSCDGKARAAAGKSAVDVFGEQRALRYRRKRVEAVQSTVRGAG